MSVNSTTKSNRNFNSSRRGRNTHRSSQKSSKQVVFVTVYSLSLFFAIYHLLHEQIAYSLFFNAMAYFLLWAFWILIHKKWIRGKQISTLWLRVHLFSLLFQTAIFFVFFEEDAAHNLPKPIFQTENVESQSEINP